MKPREQKALLTALATKEFNCEYKLQTCLESYSWKYDGVEEMNGPCLVFPRFRTVVKCRAEPLGLYHKPHRLVITKGCNGCRVSPRSVLTFFAGPCKQPCRLLPCHRMSCDVGKGLGTHQEQCSSSRGKDICLLSE